MTATDEELKALTFADDTPDIGILAKCYNDTLTDIGTFFEDCSESYNQRRNLWPGKAHDLRKHNGPAGAATPWEGASDTEANTVAEGINTYVSLCAYSLSRANIQGLAVSADDFARASSVSKMMKYLRDTWISGFKEQMEMGANFFFEKGMIVTQVSWQKELRTRLQRFTVEQLEMMKPGIGEMIASGGVDAELAALIMQMLPTVREPRAKRAVRDLREKGVAELTVAVRTVDRPTVEALAPDADVFWPASVIDIQRSPVIFRRYFLSPQEIEKKVTNDGWNREWADHVIANYRGKDTWRMDGETSGSNTTQRLTWNIVPPTDDDLVMVVEAFQRLIDDDGAEGIYRTVFAPQFTGEGQQIHPYALHELFDGFDDYPFVVTVLSREQKRLYEGSNFGMMLRGTQFCVKTERDQRIDRASLTMGPPLLHPPGRAPSDWGPFRKVTQRRPGEYQFGPIPPADTGSKEVEQTMIEQALRLIGLDYNIPNAPIRQQFYVDKFLTHCKDVLKMARKLCRRFGPPMIDVRITGDPNAEPYDNTMDDEDMDVSITFDSLNTDPKTMEAKLQGFAMLLGMDKYGVINGPELMYMLGNSLDSSIAAGVMQPAQVAQQKITSAVLSDLSQIYAGIGVGAQPNGAAIALPLIQQYLQQPDIAERYQTDEAFQERLDDYAKQYQFQLQQAENAETGKIGTPPALFQNTNTAAA